MAYVDWMLKGKRLVNCSCDYGCPCEFNALPTRDFCEGLEAMEVEEGHFGDVRLDGLRVGASFHWPGAVYLGGGSCQGFIDERADAAQREAIIKILSGEEQEPHTVFNIYGATMATEFDTVFAAIEFECDVEARTARFVVPGHLDLSVTPIVNPVTGKPHRAQIRLPEGWEFRQAEAANAKFTGAGEISFDYRDSYAALFRVAYGPYGIIE